MRLEVHSVEDWLGEFRTTLLNLATVSNTPNRGDLAWFPISPAAGTASDEARVPEYHVSYVL
jgi:hypothetical protein